mgnify:CR=1 FL=1
MHHFNFIICLASLSICFDLLLCSVWRTFTGDTLSADLSFHKRFLPVTRFQDFYMSILARFQGFYMSILTRFQDFCLHMLFLCHDDRFFSTVEYVFFTDQIDQTALSHFFEHLRLHARQIHLSAVSLQFFYKIDHCLYA